VEYSGQAFFNNRCIGGYVNRKKPEFWNKFFKQAQETVAIVLLIPISL
jgi:hypothetical protein